MRKRRFEGSDVSSCWSCPASEAASKYMLVESGANVGFHVPS